MNAAMKVSSGTETLWHALSIAETAKLLDTDPAKGLNPAEAADRLAEYGPNRLPEGKKRGPFARFVTQLNNILVYVLLAAGFTKLMLGLWLDAGIILGVVLLNALLGFIQEGRAEKALELHPQHAVGGRAHHARRRDAHDPSRRSRARRCRPARVRR